MAKIKHLNFNAPAPDLNLQSTGGKLVRLSSLWAKKPALLAFTRHFGCTQCKEMLEELVQGKDRIAAAGLELGVVYQGDAPSTAKFAAEFAPGLRFFADPERKAYRAYGLERGTLFQTILNWQVLRAVARSRKKGYPVEMPPAGQDAMQMSGTFIIGPDGRIRMPFYYDHIADHPALDLLLAGVLGSKWDKPLEGPIGSKK